MKLSIYPQLHHRHPTPKTRQPQTRTQSLAILADPVYSATDERVTRKPANNQLGSELEIERSALARSAKA
jgi:hypothetical protein